MNKMTVLYQDAQQSLQIPLEALELKQRILWLDGEVTSETANALVRKFAYLASKNDQPIILAIDSPGGSVDAGLAICDAIEGCGLKVTTVCVGRAYSMAAIILAHGDERLILPNSKVMIHQPLIQQMPGGSSDDIEILSTSLKNTKDQLNAILKKKTGKTAKEIDRATKHDTYFTAREALDFGLVDKVVALSEAFPREEAPVW